VIDRWEVSVAVDGPWLLLRVRTRLGLEWGTLDPWEVHEGDEGRLVVSRRQQWRAQYGYRGRRGMSTLGDG